MIYDDNNNNDHNDNNTNGNMTDGVRRRIANGRRASAGASRGTRPNIII